MLTINLNTKTIGFHSGQEQKIYAQILKMWYSNSLLLNYSFPVRALMSGELGTTVTELTLIGIDDWQLKRFKNDTSHSNNNIQ